VSAAQFPYGAPAHVVLADANVLYSRVLRDYLLYAATARVITVNWSQAILDDVAEHMAANIPGFTLQPAAYLLAKMTEAFPVARVEPGPAEYARLAGYELPDEDDRDVMAAALTAGADVICTNNLAHFPQPVMDDLKLVAMQPDDLFCHLFESHPDAMLQVHRTTVQKLHDATDASTIAALRKAQAPNTASQVTRLVGLSPQG